MVIYIIILQTKHSLSHRMFEFGSPLLCNHLSWSHFSYSFLKWNHLLKNFVMLLFFIMEGSQHAQCAIYIAGILLSSCKGFVSACLIELFNTKMSLYKLFLQSFKGFSALMDFSILGCVCNDAYALLIWHIALRNFLDQDVNHKRPWLSLSYIFLDPTKSSVHDTVIHITPEGGVWYSITMYRSIWSIHPTSNFTFFFLPAYKMFHFLLDDCFSRMHAFESLSTRGSSRRSMCICVHTVKWVFSLLYIIYMSPFHASFWYAGVDVGKKEGGGGWWMEELQHPKLSSMVIKMKGGTWGAGEGRGINPPGTYVGSPLDLNHLDDL